MSRTTAVQTEKYFNNNQYKSPLSDWAEGILYIFAFFGKMLLGEPCFLLGEKRNNMFWGKIKKRPVFEPRFGSSTVGRAMILKNLPR